MAVHNRTDSRPRVPFEESPQICAVFPNKKATMDIFMDRDNASVVANEEPAVGLFAGVLFKKRLEFCPNP